jgi:LysR family transcriptional activator of nhaA
MVLNYRHLYYFWVVTKEGGFARAAQRLDMAVQTISAQVRELERSLGHQLLKPAGRGLGLTEAGAAAFARAEEIFQLGQLIPDEVRAAAEAPTVRCAVGLSDGLSKLAAHALLAPVLTTSSLHLVCHEGDVAHLVAELSLHHLDMVLAGQSAPRNPNLRLTSERLAASPVFWYGPANHVRDEDIAQFPHSLRQLPVLLPTSHSALRPALDRWFESLKLQPRIVGEFQDSALMAVFAARGLGVFPVSSLGAKDAGLMHGMRLLGRCDEVKEEVHAIRSRRGQHHPLVLQVLAAARDVLEEAHAGAGLSSV